MQAHSTAVTCTLNETRPGKNWTSPTHRPARWAPDFPVATLPIRRFHKISWSWVLLYFLSKKNLPTVKESVTCDERFDEFDDLIGAPHTATRCNVSVICHEDRTHPQGWDRHVHLSANDLVPVQDPGNIMKHLETMTLYVSHERFRTWKLSKCLIKTFNWRCPPHHADWCIWIHWWEMDGGHLVPPSRPSIQWA